MLFDRWRARRAIATRTGPSPIEDFADPRLVEVVESLKTAVGAQISLGDPSWHCRWDGALQLVGLDASSRSVTDVRQRLLRLAHECDLRHLPRRARRILLVVLCSPREGEDLQGWFKRLDDDQGEVGASDWRAAKRRMAVLALDGEGGRQLFGGDRDVREATSALLGPATAGS
jgi:hypothetical protein